MRGCGGVLFGLPHGLVFARRARDYSAPVNFISAGLKKGAAEEAELEDSDDEEKPVKQDEFPKDFGPKKLKTVASLLKDCELSNSPGRSLPPKHLPASGRVGWGSAAGVWLWDFPCGGRCFEVWRVWCCLFSVLTHAMDVHSVGMTCRVALRGCQASFPIGQACFFRFLFFFIN